MPTASLPRLMADDAGLQSRTTPRTLACDAVGAGYAALTRLVGRGVDVALADGITLQVAFAADKGAAGADAVLLEGPYGALYLDEGGPFLLALTGIDISAFAAAPPAQREWLHAGVLGRLRGTPWENMTRLVPGARPVPAPEQAMLHLSLQDGSHAVGTLARAGAACWQALLSAYPLQSKRVPQSAFFPLPVPVVARIGRHVLPQGVVAGLGPGDIIVPTHPDVDVHGEGWLRCPHALARVRYGLAGTVEFLSMESLVQTDHEPGLPVEPQAALPDLDRMPMQLEFRLGALALTLGQLRELAPGSIFQLDGAADGAVAIVCGGQRLGQGEPVDVEGRLGIRITRWDLP